MNRIELKVLFLWITYLDHSSEKVWGIWFFLVQMTIVEIYRGCLLKLPFLKTKSWCMMYFELNLRSKWFQTIFSFICSGYITLWYDAKIQSKLIWNQFELKSILNHIQLQINWMSSNIKLKQSCMLILKVIRSCSFLHHWQWNGNPFWYFLKTNSRIFRRLKDLAHPQSSLKNTH